MKRFKAMLVSGNKIPYDSWTFVVVPEAIQSEWNKARCDVKGTINGEPFRGTVSRGEGVHRMPVKKELLEKIGVAKGATVNVAMELDSEPRLVEVPEELQAVFKQDESLAKLFEAMSPSHRRAWASYVAEAKRPETRVRRAQQAPDGIRARVYPNQ
jgi:hypothetical protein